MPQSQILNAVAGRISNSAILKSAEVNYRFSGLSISFLDSFLKKVNLLLTRTTIPFSKIFLSKLDWKSIAIFLFICTQIIFPGFGVSNAGTALQTTSPVGSVSNQSGFAFSLAIFIISLAGILIVFIKDTQKRYVGYLSFFEIILLLFFISLEVTTLASSYFSISFIWLLKVCRGIAIYFIFSRIILNESILKIICLSFLSITILETALALAQYASGSIIGLPIETAGRTTNIDKLYLYLNGTQVFRPAGTLSQENILAYVIAFTLPFSLVLTFSKNLRVKILSIFAVAGCAAVSLLTLSRFGTTTLIFSFIAFYSILFLIKPKKFIIRIVLPLAAIAVLTFLGIFALNSDIFTRFSYVLPSDVSFISRFELINQAVTVFKNNPLIGIGGGTFPQYLTVYDFTTSGISTYFVAPVHNFYFLLLSEQGILPGLLFTLLIAITIISFIKTIINKKTYFQDEKYIYLAAIMTSILTFLFHGLWELKALDEHLTILFWLSIGLFFNLTGGKVVRKKFKRLSR